MLDKTQTLLVYAGWLEKPGAADPPLLGTIRFDAVRGADAVSFEYAPSWLTSPGGNLFLDPDLHHAEGPQFPAPRRSSFGMLRDAMPDRWGRTLLQRRENAYAAADGRKPRKLTERDFLTELADELRAGGLRFKRSADGPFLTSTAQPVPPLASLRELENSSLSLEDRSSPADVAKLRMLLSPGSSLGGARPKSNVIAPDGTLFIAKFPSCQDDWDVGAWEFVANGLMRACGLRCARASMRRLSRHGATYLSKRFDRRGSARLHFMSAMTALAKTDGEAGSYLDVALFLLEHGARPEEDVRELWRRVAFGIAVSNGDDHLRNHGFLLGSDGWALAPAFDVNPVAYGDVLTTAYGPGGQTAMDLTALIDVAPDYGIPKDAAREDVAAMCATVDGSWRRLAADAGIAKGEVVDMSPAFDMRYKNAPSRLFGFTGAHAADEKRDGSVPVKRRRL